MNHHASLNGTVFFKLIIDKKQNISRFKKGEPKYYLYLKQKKDWYRDPLNKEKAKEYSKKYSKKRYMINMSRKYWLYWPMMFFFISLPDVSLSRQKFYQNWHKHNYYKKNSQLIKEKRIIKQMKGEKK